MTISVVRNHDVSYLDGELLGADGRLRLLPASTYRAIPRDDLRLWCHHKARYLLPTVELVDWLKSQMGDAKTVEIGAGNGDLYWYLGIPACDSRVQTIGPEWAVAHYKALGQPPTVPPEDVTTYDALEYVTEYRPRFVIGAWVTQWAADPSTPQSSALGIKESEILSLPFVDKYILIGNMAIHGKKKIFSRKHEIYAFPWIVSRASDPTMDMIVVWSR